MSAGEALCVGAGVAALGAVAWLPPRATRVLGALCGGLVAFAIARAAGGLTTGALTGAAVALALGRYGPATVLRRLTFLVPSLLLLVFVTTLLMYHAPGSPFAGEKVISAQIEAALRAHFGIPKSAVEFFGIYLRRLFVEGSLGPSVKVQGRTVEALLAPALPVSITLGLLALMLASAAGLALGISAGLKPNSWSDSLSTLLAAVGLSLPSFVIGSVLMVVFALELHWFPVAGWGGFGQLVLPSITLALPYAAYIARLARSGTIEIMNEDFIRTARAKGLPETAVVLRHALKGAILPVVSFLGPAAAGIMTGSFVVETLFGIPGMGQWFVRGAINRDYSVVLGTALVYATLVTAFNLAVDLAYAWLDPRIRSRP